MQKSLLNLSYVQMFASWRLWMHLHAIGRQLTQMNAYLLSKRWKKWLYNYDDGDIGDDDDSDKTLMLMVVMVARSWQKKNYEFLPKIECAIWYPEKRRLFPCPKKEKDDRSKPLKWTKTGHKDKIIFRRKQQTYN